MTNAHSLFGLDPFGIEAMILCALTALGLVGFIAAGFVLLWRPGHGLSPRGKDQSSSLMGRASRELGLLALWQLERAVRSGQAHSSGPVGPARSPQ